MSEIGLGQFIKNAFNYSIGKPVNQQPSQSANENFQKAQQNTMKMLNETMQNIQNNFVRHADIMNTQMQLKQLNSMERQMLLKDLFNFPKDIKDLLVNFLKENASATMLSTKDLNALMSQTLDMSKLMLLLQTNGKSAAEKMTKMIATLNQSGIYNTQQLKELTALINACIPSADTTPAAMIKSLMIMYLPWLPLNEQTSFNIGYEADEKQNSDSENVVTIMINTKSFGLVKVMIFKDANDLHIEVNCSEEFPKKEFQESIKSEATGYDLDSGVSFTTRKSSGKEEKKDADINITQAAKVSPHLLLIIHTVINLIMKLDKNAQLVEGRSRQLD